MVDDTRRGAERIPVSARRQQASQVRIALAISALALLLALLTLATVLIHG